MSLALLLAIAAVLYIDMLSSALFTSWKSVRLRQGRSLRLFSSSSVTSEVVPKLLHLLNSPTIEKEYNELVLKSPQSSAFALPMLLLEHFKPLNVPPRPFVVALLDLSIAQHSALPNILDIARKPNESLTVCGDTHGQYHDFCRIFDDSVAGFPSASNRFVFNGDMTDRGVMGLEILLVLLTLKQCHPESVYLLRGNHETLSMNMDFGFLEEILVKYDPGVFELFQRLFATLPVGAVLDKEVFVVHGGLGPLTANSSLAQINAIDRRCTDVSGDNALTELLWSDPRPRVKGAKMSSRGIGSHYGRDITERFLSLNNLKFMIRSHECEDQGFRWLHDNRSLTVFSAPNYCNQVGNKGAVVRFEAGKGVEECRIVNFTEEKGSIYNYSFAIEKMAKMKAEKIRQIQAQRSTSME